MFHYAEYVYEKVNDEEKLFNLLLHHVILLRKRYVDLCCEEITDLFEKMEKILETNLNQYQAYR